METRGKGKFDVKRTGTEMSNGNRMNRLINFEKVTCAMLATYKEGSKEHDLLVKKIQNGILKLDAALYDATCFFKSQEKQDPEECDQILYALCCGRKDAYPGQKFNTLYAAFCAVRNYVCAYCMMHISVQ